jgi:osmotically-inducible protein OsmY
MTNQDFMDASSPGTSAFDAPSSHHGESPHQIEQDVRRSLLATPSLRFSALVIRRIDNGVCLEGFVESGCEVEDAARLANEVAGVNDVLNRLVVKHPPVKG